MKLKIFKTRESVYFKDLGYDNGWGILERITPTGPDVFNPKDECTEILMWSHGDFIVKFGKIAQILYPRKN